MQGGVSVVAVFAGIAVGELVDAGGMRSAGVLSRSGLARGMKSGSAATVAGVKLALSPAAHCRVSKLGRPPAKESDQPGYRVGGVPVHLAPGWWVQTLNASGVSGLETRR